MSAAARTFRFANAIVGLVASILSTSAGRAQEILFIPETAAHGYAVRAYEAIWQEHGEAIVAALEARTCLPFFEASVSAVVADGTSHSGGPEHPMQLRASYATEVKQSTLVHELGHRHLWQLEERLEDVDGHMTLYLILDLVWADVWGETFADTQVAHESGWRSEYDYAEAWSWARALSAEERARLWQTLLKLNGLETDCGPMAQ